MGREDPTHGSHVLLQEGALPTALEMTESEGGPLYRFYDTPQSLLQGTHMPWAVLGEVLWEAVSHLIYFVS